MLQHTSVRGDSERAHRGTWAQAYSLSLIATRDKEPGSVKGHCRIGERGKQASEVTRQLNLVDVREEGRCGEGSKWKTTYSC
jgi:hypothetical protein